MRRPRTLIGAGVAVGAVAALHAAPSLAALPSVGRRFSPSLAGVGSRGHVAITFDGGPDTASTPQLLDALDALGWRATFFVLGSMALRAPGLVEEVVAAGHEVGLHGHEHRNQLYMTPRAVRDDIARARDAVAETAGVEAVWFRPPFGALSLNGLRLARSFGLRTVLWTSRGPSRCAAATPESVVDDVLGGFVDGGTVLLHDSDRTTAFEWQPCALGALALLAKRFADLGLVVGSLGDHGIAP